MGAGKEYNEAGYTKLNTTEALQERFESMIKSAESLVGQNLAVGSGSVLDKETFRKSW